MSFVASTVNASRLLLLLFLNTPRSFTSCFFYKLITSLLFFLQATESLTLTSLCSPPPFSCSAQCVLAEVPFLCKSGSSDEVEGPYRLLKGKIWRCDFPLLSRDSRSRRRISFPPYVCEVSSILFSIAFGSFRPVVRGLFFP